MALHMSPWMTFCYLFMSTVGLFTSIWEQYGTGLLDLGLISGPTEGILLCCVMFLLSATKGIAFWATPIAASPLFEKTIPFPAVLNGLLPFENKAGSLTVTIDNPRSLLFAFFFLSWIPTVFTNVYHVFVRPSVHRDSKTVFVAAAPTVFMTLLHYTVFLHFPDLQEKFPFALEFSYGLLVSYTVTKLTISRLCKMPYNGYFLLYVLNALVSLACVAYVVAPCLRARVSRDVFVHYAGQAFATLAGLGLVLYALMAVTVFRQIARYLGINIMTIKKR
ncbi:ethanolaminephosphotransferase [Angomonas deanei]|nr:ethanolaminephosphotransferase [Angomonas deanei]|eukprot:EPY30536.1 ethanolaminephosphotransferase [Angomonas deanei]